MDTKRSSINTALAEKLVLELAGSLPMLKKWRSKSLHQIITQTKLDYFLKRPQREKEI